MAPYRPRRSAYRKARIPHTRKMRLYKNLPMRFPKPSNLLSKSQYCDFELTSIVAMKSRGPITSPQEASVCFPRFDYGNVNNELYGFDSSPLWDRLVRVFEEYAIKGFRMEYLPTNYVGSQEVGDQVANKGAIIKAFVYQDLNTRDIRAYSTD